MPPKKLSTEQLVTMLARTCRQTLVYLNGNSCMDDKRVKQALNKALKECDSFKTQS